MTNKQPLLPQGKNEGGRGEKPNPKTAQELPRAFDNGAVLTVHPPGFLCISSFLCGQSMRGWKVLDLM